MVVDNNKDESINPPCPLCRCDIRVPDITSIPYTQIFELDDILSNKTIRNFIDDNTKFEKEKTLVSKIFNYEMLSLLTSAKRNQTYTLYKPINKSLISKSRDGNNQELNLNNFTTWKLERLNNKIKYTYEVLAKIEVPCENVLVDIEYCTHEMQQTYGMTSLFKNYRNTNGDVVILSGNYKVIDTYNSVMDLTYFVPENKTKLIVNERTHIYFVSIDKLKYLCKLLKISSYTKMNREQLVDALIKTSQNAQSAQNSQSAVISSIVF